MSEVWLGKRGDLIGEIVTDLSEALGGASVALALERVCAWEVVASERSAVRTSVQEEARIWVGEGAYEVSSTDASLQGLRELVGRIIAVEQLGVLERGERGCGALKEGEHFERTAVAVQVERALIWGALRALQASMEEQGQVSARLWAGVAESEGCWVDLWGEERADRRVFWVEAQVECLGQRLVSGRLQADAASAVEFLSAIEEEYLELAALCAGYTALQEVEAGEYSVVVGPEICAVLLELLVEELERREAAVGLKVASGKVDVEVVGAQGLASWRVNKAKSLLGKGKVVSSPKQAVACGGVRAITLAPGDAGVEELWAEAHDGLYLRGFCHAVMGEHQVVEFEAEYAHRIVDGVLVERLKGVRLVADIFSLWQRCHGLGERATMRRVLVDSKGIEVLVEVPASYFSGVALTSTK